MAPAKLALGQITCVHEDLAEIHDVHFFTFKTLSHLNLNDEKNVQRDERDQERNKKSIYP